MERYVEGWRKVRTEKREWAWEEGRLEEEKDTSGSLSGESLHQRVGLSRCAGMRPNVKTLSDASQRVATFFTRLPQRGSSRSVARKRVKVEKGENAEEQ